MLRDNTMDWINGNGPKNCKVNLPEAMFNYSICTLADALAAFPNCRQGRGLTPLDRSLIIQEIVTKDGYRVQLIKNRLPGKNNWVQITY